MSPEAQAGSLAAAERKGWFSIAWNNGYSVLR